METRLAILQVADTSPLESLVVMLRAAGYSCALPDKSLRAELIDAGCDTVYAHESLVNGRGYEREKFNLPEVGPKAVDRAALYVDVKAHRNGPKVVARWPRLAGRVLWYRINGGEPMIGPKGNELAPGCPILTPNAWYKGRDDAYWFWPMFARWEQHLAPRRPGNDAVCLVHNLKGWGYADIGEYLRASGASIKMHGTHGSPDGMIPHAKIPAVLASAKVMVHLKSNDCPGYALVEAVASRCPVILSRKLIWRMRQEDLWVEGETCLCYDRPTHEPRTPEETERYGREILGHLDTLKERPEVGEAIAMRAFGRYARLSWKEGRDGPGFRAWMRGNFK